MVFVFFQIIQPERLKLWNQKMEFSALNGTPKSYASHEGPGSIMEEELERVEGLKGEEKCYEWPASRHGMAVALISSQRLLLPRPDLYTSQTHHE